MSLRLSVPTVNPVESFIDISGVAEPREPVARVPVERLDVGAFLIPTESPEADGTLEWSSTTLVTVELSAGGQTGFGYSYSDAAAAALVHGRLRPLIEGADVFEHGAVLARMLRQVRNLDQTGLVAMALSAVDAAFWDLKARLLGTSLMRLLGVCRRSVPIYGSGGFTSYSVEHLEAQVAGWVEEGIPRVKMKVGADPEADPERVAAARRAIGEGVELYVDANGAYAEKQAVWMADRFAEQHVSWFEEPVSSDDLPALARIRAALPEGMELSAGEYGDGSRYFLRMLQAQAVDVLQADATRCLGITGLLEAGAIADAFEVPMSTHCAPSLHLHAACALPRFRHLEYFHDHARIERMLFDGFVEPHAGTLTPDPEVPGLGITFKRRDAARFEV
ncbi:MAG: enolase C-terminal domain-like protein [Myxococcaceae bacterium]